MSGIAACGAKPSAPVAHQASPDRHYIARQLRTGKARQGSNRTTFDLTIHGADATLVETDEVGPASTVGTSDTIAWTPKASRVYRGSAVRDHGAWMLDLTSAGVQPIALRCDDKPVEVAPAGARRVKTPGYTSECGDRGVWDPPATLHVPALRCGEAIQPAVDTGDDDDFLVFGAPPGIELAGENDDCYIQGQGLRRLR